MTRKRLNLALISNHSARKVCFKRRKSGLLKKVYEFSTLCDVEAFLIIFSPYDLEPTVWPSCHEVQECLEKYRNRLETQHTNKVMNHEGYLKSMIGKMSDRSKKQVKINKILETQYLMYQVCNDEIDGLELFEMHTALKILLDKMKTIKMRLAQLQTTSQPLSSSYDFLPTGPEISQPKETIIGAVNNISCDLLGKQWMTGNNGREPIQDSYGGISVIATGMGLVGNDNVVDAKNDYCTIQSSGLPNHGYLGEDSTSGVKNSAAAWIPWKSKQC